MRIGALARIGAQQQDCGFVAAEGRGSDGPGLAGALAGDLVLAPVQLERLVSPVGTESQGGQGEKREARNAVLNARRVHSACMLQAAPVFERFTQRWGKLGRVGWRKGGEEGLNRMEEGGEEGLTSIGWPFQFASTSVAILRATA